MPARRCRGEFQACGCAPGSIRSLQTTSYHSSFTGRLLGITVAFERRLAEAGVELLNTASAPPVREAAVGASRRVVEAARAGEASAALAALGAFRLLCAHRRGPHGVATWNAIVEGWLAQQLDRFAEDAWCDIDFVEASSTSAASCSPAAATGPPGGSRCSSLLPARARRRCFPR
jgi:hypothetical protein